MATIKIKRGQSNNLATLNLEAGEPAFDLTNGKLYVGNGTNKILINPDAVYPVTKVNGQTGEVTLTKGDVGLGNVDNTSDANKPVSTATQSALGNKEDTAKKGAANGYASLDANAKVPLTQINDALLGNVNFQGLWNASSNTPALPATPATKGHYYVVSTAGTQFGIKYEVGDWIIAESSAWNKVSNTDAVASVAGRTGNVTLAKGDVGLGNVDNTSDANKPISTATQTALDGKAATSHGNHVPTTQTANNATFLRNDNSWFTVTPANIGAAATSHGNHVPTTETANNTKFLRNDNSWQTVTPGNIGAAESGHTHSYAGSASIGGAATTALACTGNAATASAVAWSGVTGKPTTLSGYGITDAIGTSSTIDGGTF